MLENKSLKILKKKNQLTPTFMKISSTTFSLVDRKNEGNDSRDILARARPSVQCRFPTWNTQHTENCHRWSRQIRQSMKYSHEVLSLVSAPIYIYTSLNKGNPQCGSNTPTPLVFVFFLILMLSISLVFLRNLFFSDFC